MMKAGSAWLIATVLAMPPAAQQATTPQTQNRTRPVQPQTLSNSDVMYAKRMIAHHQQGIMMMQMAEQRGTPTVKAMASRMEKDQQREIGQLSAWTGAATEQPTSTSGQMDSRMMAASGMEFDKMFLEMMSQHHQGAIDMSKQSLPQLKDARVKAFARQTVTKQSAEKMEMQRMLATKK